MASAGQSCSDSENIVLNNKTKFVEVGLKVSDKTSVWHYFLRSEDKVSAKCKEPLCQQIIKCSGGSTSGMQSHLRVKHKIDLRKKSVADAEQEERVPNPARKTKSKTLDDFFPRNANKRKLAEVVAEMVAKDGLTFRVFTTSERLRACLRAQGYDVPTSPNSIKRMVVKFSKNVRRKEKADVKKLASGGERFCITFDEWTSLRNRRYLSLILHGRKSEIWNLGLIRIRRTMTSERCLSLVEKRLKTFDLTVNDHIICIMTDGTSVITKIGKISAAYQQLCFAHGIQLAVIDVLYKKEKKIVEEEIDDNESENSDDGESEAGDEEDNMDNNGETGDVDSEDVIECDNIDDEEYIDDTTEADADAEYCELTENVKPLIDKVRKIVKQFRKSPKKNEKLQRYVKDDFGKELVLTLDSKTRWNSLATMLKRFYDLRNCVKKALVDVCPKVTIEESEIELSDIVNSLEPIQAAVEALCRRDANLITADATLIFTLKKLHEQGTQLSMALFDALNRRIQERRTLMSGVLQFLHSNSGSAINESDLETSFSSEVADTFKTPSKITLETTIKNILFRLEGTNFMYPHEATGSSDSENSPKKKKPKKSKSEVHSDLDIAINKAMSVNYAEKIKTDKTSLAKIVRQEMSLFQNVGNRGYRLSKVYEYLLTIKPTSIESERAFSSSGYLCKKLRSNMNDNTLDHLSSLRTFFQTKNINVN